MRIVQGSLYQVKLLFPVMPGLKHLNNSVMLSPGDVFLVLTAADVASANHLCQLFLSDGSFARVFAGNLFSGCVTRIPRRDK